MPGRLALVALALTTSAVMLSGQVAGPDPQGQAYEHTAFEVASVRLNTSGQRGASLRMQPNGDFMAVNQPLRVLIQIAYALPLFRVENMPDWFTSERYDITAKAPDGLSRESSATVRGRLLRSLLEERFAMKARMVTKEVPAMLLGFARDDHRLGTKLRRSNAECLPAVPRAGDAAPAPAPRARTEPVCAMGGSSGSPICGRGVTMEQFVQGMGGVYQQPVVDETALDGRWDFDLSFTPDRQGGPGISFGAPCPPQSDDRPALSTAMQEQLGLRIRTGRAPIEMLVIDSADRPREN
jgi:uncharacterized protein (TIGR03435 family)